MLENYPSKIEAIPVLIEGIGHMGKKSGLKKLPKILELINEVLG